MIGGVEASDEISTGNELAGIFSDPEDEIGANDKNSTSVAFTG